MSFSSNADEMLAALRVTPGWSEMQVAIDDEDVAAILSEAAKVAKDVIAPLNTLGDRVGAQFTDGTVKVPVEYRKAYQALAEGGWIGIEHQPDLGGQGLPLTLFVAVNQLFERACPAFTIRCSRVNRSTMIHANASLPNSWQSAANTTYFMRFTKSWCKRSTTSGPAVTFSASTSMRSLPPCCSLCCGKTINRAVWQSKIWRMRHSICFSMGV